MSDEKSILPRWCNPVARIASQVYGGVVQTRNRRRDLGIGVRAIDRPVISIGNIVVGGTGKSPMVRWVAEWALARGVTPLIALRGYRSERGRSDEASEHEALVPGARLAVGPDRFKTITAMLSKEPGIGLVLLDDGFQHRVLARDLDIVLIDASRPQLAGSLLPLGWLREPVESLRRADAVIVTRAREVDHGLNEQIVQLHGKPALAWCNHAWSDLDVHEAARSQRQSVDWLRGRRIAVWAGIGRPDAFVQQLNTFGAEVVAIASLRDHARYGRRAVSRLAKEARRSGAAAIATTGKDWVKIGFDGSVVDLPIVVPRLEMRFCAGEAAVRDRLEATLQKR